MLTMQNPTLAGFLGGIKSEYWRASVPALTDAVVKQTLNLACDR